MHYSVLLVLSAMSADLCDVCMCVCMCVCVCVCEICILTLCAGDSLKDFGAGKDVPPDQVDLQLSHMFLLCVCSKCSCNFFRVNQIK